MDSFIYWEADRVYVQCPACQEKNAKGVAWPEIYGYGETVVCQCGVIIHKNDQTSTTD